MRLFSRPPKVARGRQSVVSKSYFLFSRRRTESYRSDRGPLPTPPEPVEPAGLNVPLPTAPRPRPASKYEHICKGVTTSLKETFQKKLFFGKPYFPLFSFQNFF